MCFFCIPLKEKKYLTIRDQRALVAVHAWPVPSAVAVVKTPSVVFSSVGSPFGFRYISFLIDWWPESSKRFKFACVKAWTEGAIPYKNPYGMGMHPKGRCDSLVKLWLWLTSHLQWQSIEGLRFGHNSREAQTWWSSQLQSFQTSALEAVEGFDACCP